MKNQDANKLEITLTKKFTDTQKKVLLLAPLVLGLAITVIYFVTSDSSTATNQPSSLDLSLPESNSKTLPDDKSAVFDEFEKHQNDKDKQRKNDFYNDLSDPLGEKNNQQVSTGSLTSDASEKDSMYLEIQKQLEALEKKKERSTQRTSNSGFSGASSRSASVSRKEQTEDWSVETKQELNSFFQETPDVVSTTESLSQKNSDAFIYAAINNDQQIMNNERVEIRLTKDALIDGKIYKQNTMIYAQAVFGRNRVNLNINSINHTPVELEAYDSQDGNKGIYIEDQDLIGETTREAADDLSQDVNVSGVPIGNTVKKIFRKKNRESSVYLINNYKLILKVKQ